MQTKGDGRQGTDVITLLLYLSSLSLSRYNKWEIRGQTAPPQHMGAGKCIARFD